MNHNRNIAGAATGFTLIELLTVILIISLLVGILVPTVRAVIQAASAANTNATIQSLSGGIQQYYTENNNVYPGQNVPSTFVYGSHWLMRAMFTRKGATSVNYSAAPAADFPLDAYVPIKAGLIRDNTGTNYSSAFLGDGYPSPMAICYYPARLGVSGLGQFVEGDNSTHTTGNTGGTFSDFIKDTRLDTGGNTPYRSGQYLLIAPGSDRKYFTRDDVKNW
ncbi:MAG TPA: hypothetical protein DCX07_01765 [Phycisphaerales bacterium]|nr:hypothetical protein [Phycisphaerales bacterium]